jgi:hypothetical protein
MTDDIAGQIEQLLKYPALTCGEAATTLRALAQENERLKGEYADLKKQFSACAECEETFRRLEAERDAIRAKTIGDACEAIRRYFHGVAEMEYLRDCLVSALATPVTEPAPEPF